jgi:hypothetical protein
MWNGRTLKKIREMLGTNLMILEKKKMEESTTYVRI